MALGNPIDLTAAIFDDTDLCRKALELIIDDPLVDAVAMANAGLQGEIATKVAREIVNVARRSDKPIMLGWSARRLDAELEAFDAHVARSRRFRT